MSGDGADFREMFSRSLAKIVQLKSEIERLEAAPHAPLAIVGMACRFPGGGDHPAAFWQALEAGVDGIRRIPAQRWTIDEAASPATRWAGLLESVDGFDAAFFGMSPREATRLDPQQRLLLELSWEALEQAGQVAERLAGTRTGVFLGMSSCDYLLLMETLQPDVYSVLGGLASTAAGRLSYTFGLQGPCATLDTACSSSMTAIHLACQSLRNGETNMALAGGVNLILSPKNIAATAELQAMSPEGRCKTFDAEANGFALSEGAGIVVIKRAADALRDGDPILALIRSSAVNQDGRSTGLTVPNVLSQQALLREAIKKAGIAAADIGYIETHGTATSLGDPIEFEALREVLGAPRPDGMPCVLGAVKTNVGHTAAAAGVAGLIKAVLCLQHQAIPRNLNFRTLNPRISLEGTPFEIPTQTRNWESFGKPRRAGVSSFGISGTNAHVIVEEAPRVDAKLPRQSSSYLVPLSGKTPAALAALARSYQEWLDVNDDAALHHIAYTTGVRRNHLEHRLCLFGSSKAELVQALNEVIADRLPVDCARGKAAVTSPKLVFVFSGQGSQWVGMGQKLYQEEAVFRDALAACSDAIQKEAGFSIVEELQKPAETSRLSETVVAQPALFAVEVALAALLKSWGIVPTAVIGHSVGEVVAAHIAGALELAEAARLVTLRARVMQKATGHGKMVSVELSQDAARQAIGGYADRVGIAAVNDPGSVVLSGEIAAVDDIVAQLVERGVQTRALRVNYAFHSPQMEPLVREFLQALGSVVVKPGSMKLKMFSTVTGRLLSEKELTAGYWGQNIRQTVRFADAVAAAMGDGGHCFVEMGPHPVLTLSMEQILPAGSQQHAVIPMLRRDQDERRSTLAALGKLYTLGCRVNWHALFPDGGRVLPLPTYPWQRERYWVAPPPIAKVAGNKQSEPESELFYRLAWHLQPLKGRPRSSPGRWIIFMDDSGVGTSLAEKLEAAGSSCVKVVPSSEYGVLSPLHFQINPSEPEHYRRLIHDLGDSSEPAVGVIHLWSLNATSLDRATTETLDEDLLHGTLSASYLVAALDYQGWKQAPKLCLVSRGAQSVGDTDAALSISQAALWGLGRSVVLEHPEFQTTLVDLPQLGAELALDGLWREVVTTSGESQVALRADGRYCAQLVRERLSLQSPNKLTFQADSSYLITGGLGALGRALAQWMITRGARNLVLVSRNPPTEEGQRTIAAMEAAGARIMVACTDVSKREEVAGMMSLIAESMPPVRGIVHAAGTVQTTPELTRDSLLAVTSSKVQGGWNLHEAARELELDFFVMYSSASALLGLVGGAGYAAANAFLDGLAQARRSLALPAVSVQWGAFGEVGMLVSAKGETSSFGAFTPLQLTEAHQALVAALDAPHAAIGVMQLSVPRHLELFPQLAEDFFWAALKSQHALEKTPPAALPTSRRVVQRVLHARPEARHGLLTLHVRATLAQILHLEPARLPVDATFHALGMDSLMCFELRNRLESELGTRIPIKDILAAGQLDVLVHLLEQRIWPTEGVEVAATPLAPGRWVVIPRPNPKAKLRLICFPYAGGNASVYTPWLELLPSEVELCAIQPPGRQERVHEPLLQTVEQMVAALLPELLPYLDRPFAMFGHCVGAMVMYEVIRELGSKHQLQPVHIFPSGAMPPPQYLLPPVLTSPSTEEFVGILRLLGFADESLLGDEESVRDLLPAVSADFDLAIRYECSSSLRLDMPVTLFCGREDQLGPPDRTAGWKQLTTSRFEQVVFPGEHYFITPERSALLRIINEELLHHIAVREQQHSVTKWVQVPVPRKNPAMRLFCFPGAWELPAVFDAWSSLMGEDVEVCIIERPGYGQRTHELPLRRVDDLVSFIAPALEPYLDRPFAFLGHNVGSIMMFEVARSLRRAGQPLPFHLFVAATDAPHLYWSGPIHIATTERILDGLKLVHVTIDPRITEPLLRADSTVLVSYTFASEAPLAVPITAVIGENDHFVPRGAIRGWKEATSAPFTLHTIAADHNLIVEATDVLTALIKDACQPLLTNKKD